MKTVLVLSENKEWKKNLSFEFEKSDQFPIKFNSVSTRADVIGELARTNYDAIIIASLLPVTHLMIVLKYLSSNEYYRKPIFFLSENFLEFDVLLKEVEFPYINLLTLPADFKELAHHLRVSLFKIETKKQNSKEKINIEFLKIFIDSTKYILENFCTLSQLKHEKPFLYNNQEALNFAIFGTLELTSDFFKGKFHIAFDKEIYLNIIEILLSQKYSEINDENMDFAGEISNMIYGHAKTTLNQNGHNFEKVIPKFIVNPGLFITDLTTVVVPIDSNYGKIYILIEIYDH